MVDPQLDIEPYLQVAEQKGMAITHIFETHVQADHLSGARHLSAITGAPILLHELAGVRFPHVDMEDGEEHELGHVRASVLHTPGHTRDSVCLLVADLTCAPEPWFVLTGDTLFAGGVGQPDRLGPGTEAMQAEQLHESLFGKLLVLPDHVEIHPAHFAGATFGKGLSDKLGSTIGFERRFNPALQRRSKADFIRFVLADLSPEPAEFTSNRRKNLGLNDE